MAESVDMHIGGYHLTEPVGTGGMGSVFRATVEADGTPLPKGSIVAVKLLHPHLRTVEEFVKRFHREARLAAAIDHPNVVRVLDEGVHDKRHHYIVMEYAEGLKLNDLIGDSQPLSPQQTIEVMNQICEALKAAASVADPDDLARTRSLVHRDIKPDNIIVQPLDRKQMDTMTQTGDKTALASIRVKLLDFGLAKDVKALSTILSQTGQSLGTPAYMSPEQCKGDDVDQRSDIYSLGVVAYHMITGTQPFAGPTTVAYATQHAEEIPPDILKRNPLCPKNLADCIYRCLAKSPADRYAAPAELQADLARVAKGQSVAKVYKFKKKGSFSHRKVAAIAAASIIACLLAVAGGWYFMTDSVKGDLAKATGDARVAIAAGQFDQAKGILQKAIDAVPSRNDRSTLIAEPQKLLEQISAQAARQEQERSQAEADRLAAAAKAQAEQMEKERQAAEAAAKAKHEQDALAALADIKAKTAAGQYQAAIDAANAAIKTFADTPSGKELPDLLATATEKLQGRLQAENAREEAERKRKEEQDRLETERLAAEAKAKHERFIKYRDEGAAAFKAKDYETAKIALANALKEQDDADVRRMLDEAIDRTTRHRIAVADFKVIGDVGINQAGQSVPELLLPKFGDRFIVIERAQLAAILNEVDLTIAQVVENPALLKSKKVSGVRYLILGSVTKLGNISISARLVDIVKDPGVHVQSAEVSAEDARGLQNALGELAKILQMTPDEKKAYLDERQFPQLVSQARAQVGIAQNAVNDAKRICIAFARDVATVKEYEEACAKPPVEFAAAVALYRRSLAIRCTPELENELKNVLAEQDDWNRKQESDRQRELAFAKLYAEARRLADSLPADRNNLSETHKRTSAEALRAIQAALEYKPADRDALALKDKIDSYLGQAKELTLDLGNNVTMKLVLIPAGKFTMGSAKREQEDFTKSAIAAGFKEGSFSLSDEGPQREVTISMPFHMGVFEVTRGQFAAFVADSGYKTDAEKEGWSYGWDGKAPGKIEGASWKKPGFEQTDRHPVVCVSHNDAVAFCEWLSKRSGKRVKLPTEAQWEYACRAGSRTAYPWGDGPDDGKGWANAADKTAKKEIPFIYIFNWEDGYVFTAPVGQFKVNDFRLYDMIGNVWEWCSDWYDKDYYSANANTQDPQGPGNGSFRVLRGGSWYNIPQNCRSAGRGRYVPGGRFANFGFRVVVDSK